MQLTNITEIETFTKLVDECNGNVYLKSMYGDVFNLKSSMSKYVAVGRLASEAGPELELFCQNKEDEIKFMKFFRDNPNTL